MVACAASAWVLVPRAALAQSTPSADPLQVVARGDVLDEEALRAALGKELGRPVQLVHGAEAASSGERLTITWRRTSRELAVSYDARGRTVARVVAAPEAPAKVIEEASLLAANLLREDIARPDEPAVAPASPPEPAPASEPAPAATPSTKASRRKALPGRSLAVVSFFHPLASNYAEPWVRTRFELNLLHGRIGALEGVQLGTLGMVLARDEPGSAPGTAQGLQLSLLASVATGEVTGMQIGGVGTVASAGLDGVQLGAINVAALRARGVQLGGANVVAGSVRGVQLGGVNIASGAVRGVQLGLINYAKDVDGVPIGVVSVTESGGIHPTAWSSSSTFGNAGVKFATRYTYTMPYMSVHHAFDRLLLGGGGAIGARIPLGRYLGVELDVGFTYLVAPTQTPSTEKPNARWTERLYQPRVRGALHVSPLKHFSVFAGAGLVTQVRVVDVSERAEVSVRPEIFAGLQL